ncbi:MAG TPA: transketolase [Rhodospirillales bacterium]|nr:transketolase [Rhodospirillales bacterium]
MTATHKEMANAIRFLSVDAVQAAKSGHPGMPMGMADVATVLFSDFLKFDAKASGWLDRDRFVLSAGHGSMLIYSLLHLTGYKVSIKDIKSFRQIGAKTAGHPEYGHVDGVETTTGPLGQGITTAVGMALAEKMQAKRYGARAVDHYTYTIVGDGCLMEGISQEAISMAGHLQLNKLIVLWDDNEICIDGSTDMTTTDDQCKRFEASGWDTQAIDGHDAAAIRKAIAKAKKSNKPSLIACKTIIGFGAPTKAGSHSTHGAPLGEEEIQGMRKGLGWDHGPFVVPKNILDAWRKVGVRGARDRKKWEARLKKNKGAAELKRMSTGKLPNGWTDKIDAFKKQMAAEKPKLATRQASGKVLEVLTEAIPAMIGGSADLTGSVNTKTSSTKSITNKDFSGRYIHYGVREHAMGAVMNGMALHGGFIPYSGTFAVFADYMKGAMRLSALMEQRVIYVLTHDSIGLGEDGPTHQPVETLAMLRAMPNFNVFRPCDVVETAECWQVALESENTPSGMVLTRQGLAPQRTSHKKSNMVAKGAYVLAEAGKGAGKRKVTLMATGSEVEIAMAARQMLEARGTPTAVVSMPCWELFDAQSAAYREKVLGKGTVKVGVEAAMRFGWDKYIGPDGGFVGMTGFGASAPAVDLYKHFGITAENVVAEARRRL